MKTERLDNLSDGIFAIVMTILVFQIKIPLSDNISNAKLWQEIWKIEPVFLSYILSFALLFTYWKAHHFFTSIYAKNVDANLININAVFFMFVSLIPFSADLLSRHSENELSVIIFSIHIILIGLCLFWMRGYVFYSKHIKNPEISFNTLHGTTIHTLAPIFFAIVAIILSFIDTNFSLFVLTISIIFNLLPYSKKLIGVIFYKRYKLKQAEDF